MRWDDSRPRDGQALPQALPQKRSLAVRLLRACFRVAIKTFLAALLAMGIGLLLGILGMVALSLYRGGQHVDMTLAYRRVAFPLAAAGAALGFVVAVGWEVRRNSSNL